ncbi:hypothetical protein BBK36DRAFT_1193408, partial [Trichoderma citrinoviride]
PLSPRELLSQLRIHSRHAPAEGPVRYARLSYEVAHQLLHPTESTEWHWSPRAAYSMRECARSLSASSFKPVVRVPGRPHAAQPLAAQHLHPGHSAYIASELHRPCSSASDRREDSPRVDVVRPKKPTGKAIPRDMQDTSKHCVKRGCRGRLLARASTGLDSTGVINSHMIDTS